MSDINNLYKFLALFGGNSAKQNLNNIDNSAGIGNGDGVLIKAEFDRAVTGNWDIIKGNGWNGEATNKKDLIDKWWASLDVNHSNRKIAGSDITEVNALSGKELDRIDSLAQDFDWEASRADTNYKVEDIDEPDGDINNEDDKSKYTKFVNEATEHYKQVAALKTLLGDNLYKLATKDTKYLTSIISVVVSQNIESCVVDNELNYELMDKAIVNALADKVFGRSDISSNMDTSDMKELYDLRMGYVDEGNVESIEEIRDIAGDYLTVLTANYGGEELNGILSDVFGGVSALDAIKDMDAEGIKAKMQELMNSVEGLEKPEKITYTLEGFEQSYSLDIDKSETIEPTLNSDKNGAAQNVEFKLSCNDTNMIIDGLSFKSGKEGTYTLTLSAIVDGKEVAVSTITVNVEKAKLPPINPNDYSVSGSIDFNGDVIEDSPATGSINASIYKNHNSWQNPGYEVTFKSNTEGVIIGINGKITALFTTPGSHNIEISVMLDGVEVGKITKTINVKMQKDNALATLENNTNDIRDNNLGSISNIDKNIHTEFGINNEGEIVFQETTTSKVYAELLYQLRQKIDENALASLGLTDIENLLRTAWIMTYNDFNSSTRNDTYQFLNKVLDNVDKILEKVKDNPEYANLIKQHTAYANDEITNNLLNYDEIKIHYYSGFDSDSTYTNSMTDLLRKLKKAYPYIDTATIERVFEKAKEMANNICFKNIYDCPYGTGNNKSLVDDLDSQRNWGGNDNRAGDSHWMFMSEIIQMTLYCFDKLIFKEIFN